VAWYSVCWNTRTDSYACCGVNAACLTSATRVQRCKESHTTWQRLYNSQGSKHKQNAYSLTCPLYLPRLIECMSTGALFTASCRGVYVYNSVRRTQVRLLEAPNTDVAMRTSRQQPSSQWWRLEFCINECLWVLAGVNQVRPSSTELRVSMRRTCGE
jgi:hypothetical protein